jgi:hypothetical protein
MQLMQSIQYAGDSCKETNDSSDSHNPLSIIRWLPLDSPALYANGMHLLPKTTSPIVPMVKGEKHKLPLYTTRRNIGGAEAQLHSLLILALDGGGWSVSPLLLYPKQKTI